MDNIMNYSPTKNVLDEVLGMQQYGIPMNFTNVNPLNYFPTVNTGVNPSMQYGTDFSGYMENFRVKPPAADTPSSNWFDPESLRGYGSIMKGIGGLFGAYNGYNQNKLAEKQAKYAMEMGDKNYAASLLAYNNARQDRRNITPDAWKTTSDEEFKKTLLNN